MSTKMEKLSCGGKGPCCHVGYSHRHCEHCDVVIDTRPGNMWPYPGIAPYQPVPYFNRWNVGTVGGGTYNNFGDVVNAIGQAVGAGNPTVASQMTIKPLPNPTVAHVCEVNS